MSITEFEAKWIQKTYLMFQQNVVKLHDLVRANRLEDSRGTLSSVVVSILPQIECLPFREFFEGK